MKLRKIITMAAVLCTCFALAGCGETKETAKPAENSAVENEDGQNNAEQNSTEDETVDEIVDEDTPEIIETEATEEPAGSIEAGSEIKAAKLSSGYTQIGSNVFRNGGYMTLGEFAEKFGDKYELDKDDLTAEFNYSSFCFVKAKEKGTELSMEMVVGAPAAGSGTIADGVIICFKGQGELAYTNTWSPGGICYTCPDMNYDSITALYQAQGCSETEDLFPNGRNVTAAKMQENINTYYGKKADDEQTYDQTYCLVQADDENLYGAKPVFAYIFSDYHEDAEHIFFHVNWMYYGNSEVYQWS